MRSVGGWPTVVLDDRGLDLLELVLGGALTAMPPLPGVPARSDVVLVDRENTPVARLTEGASGTTVEPLRPLARGSGPAWDASLRRPAADVRGGLGEASGVGPVIALVVDALPSNDDVAAVLEATDGAAAVLCAVPLARRRRVPGLPSWAGLAIAARGLADALRDAHPGVPVIPVVVPWPAAGATRTGRTDPIRATRTSRASWPRTARPTRSG